MAEIKMKPNQRRLRQNAHIRELTQEVRVSVDQLIQPLFVVDGIPGRETIPGLTGVYRETPGSILKQIESDLEVGVRKFLLFGVPAKKATGLKGDSFSFDFTSEQIHQIKKRFGDSLWLSVDVCLCSSTTHGHCGVFDDENRHIDNGNTVTELARAALSYAQAGADCVAPSDMMDGRIAAIRSILSENHLDMTLVMSYSAKFHSKFYGPFRVAADSAPKGNPTLKDRATYQIDPRRPKDALICSRRDAAEGADILMVKPGMPYLDILANLSRKIPLPWAVYEVSGEYAAIELLAREGLMDGPQAHLEAWTAFVRAGASMIITYGARNALQWLTGPKKGA